MCAVVANVNRDPGIRPEPFTPNDFMPARKSRAKARQTPETMMEIAMFLNRAVGGQTKRLGEPATKE